MSKINKLAEYLFFLFIFLLPWQTRWIIRDTQIAGNIFEYGRISIYAFDVIFIFLFFYFLLTKIFCHPEQSDGISTKDSIGSLCEPRNDVRKKSLLLITYYLLPIIFILNFFISSNKLLTTYWWLRVAEGLLLIWLIKKINFSKTKAALAFIFSVAISAGLGIYQFLTQNVFASKWLGMAAQDPNNLGVSVIETLNTRIVRSYGNLPHPNILAGFLVLAIVLCFWLIIKTQEKSEKQEKQEKSKTKILFFLFLIFSFLLVAALFFTFSRAAWLVLAIFFITLLLYYFITKKSRSLLLITYYLLPVLLVVCCLSFIYWPLIQTRTSANSRLEVKSNTERIAGYSDAWQIIKQNPLTGVGLGNYTVALQKIKPNQPAWNYQPVHNVFVLTLAELGIPVFIFLITLLLYYLITRRHSFSFFTFHFSLFIIIAILALFDHFFWTLPSAFLLLFVLWITLRENKEI